LPVLLASLISGLAGALCQKALVKRNSYLFSMELSSAGILWWTFWRRLKSMIDGRKNDNHQTAHSSNTFFQHWTVKTWIPIWTNAMGGILVGLVIQHAGTVRKGFALILGLFLSGLLQKQNVGREQILGGLLAACSLWMHAKYPIQTSTSTTQL